MTSGCHRHYKETNAIDFLWKTNVKKKSTTSAMKLKFDDRKWQEQDNGTE